MFQLMQGIGRQNKQHMLEQTCCDHSNILAHDGPNAA
jgi:hypothetical protein